MYIPRCTDDRIELVLIAFYFFTNPVYRLRRVRSITILLDINYCEQPVSNLVAQSGCQIILYIYIYKYLRTRISYYIIGTQWTQSTVSPTYHEARNKVNWRKRRVGVKRHSTGKIVSYADPDDDQWSGERRRHLLTTAPRHRYPFVWMHVGLMCTILCYAKLRGGS